MRKWDQEIAANENCGICFFCNNPIQNELQYIKCKNNINMRYNYHGPIDKPKKCNFISHKTCFKRFKKSLLIKGLEFKCPNCNGDYTKIITKGCYYKPERDSILYSAEKPSFTTTRKTWYKVFGGKKSKKRTCKRIKVRINKDGSLNEEDMEHNRKCEQKYMYVDNPWMKPLLKKKKLTRYQKYLKKMLRNSPPFPANDYCNKKKKGNDGKMYISKPNKNNICSWKLV